MDASFFNNPLLSDVTIRQIQNGVKRDYKAHKVVLCMRSKWFAKALTGNSQEGSSSVIEMHDDDPVYFEIFLRHLYEHTWNTAVAKTKKHGDGDLHPTCNQVLTAIGVYGLADKYDVEGLRTLALKMIPQGPTDVFSAYVPRIRAGVKMVIESHYENCAKANTVMGHKICLMLIKSGSAMVKTPEFVPYVRKYPALLMDMFMVAHDNNDGKLW